MPQPKRFTDEELRAHKNERSRKRYIENKEAINAYHAKLHQIRKSDPEYMRKLREKSSAYRLANPEYTAIANAKRRESDPEKSRADSRAWFAANGEKRAIYQQNRMAKIKGSGGVLSRNIQSTLMKLQKGLCACCKADLKTSVIHKDHIMPLSLGGANVDSNIQLLCQPCNQTKHAKHPIDFMQSKGFLL